MLVGVEAYIRYNSEPQPWVYAGRPVSAQCLQEGKQQCELTLAVLRLLGIFGKGRLRDA